MKHDVTKKSLNQKSEYDRTFLISSSFSQEMWIIIVQYCPICLAALCEYSPQVIANIVLGHLPNASTLVAAYGISRTFTNVTGYSISSGMTRYVPHTYSICIRFYLHSEHPIHFC